MILTVTLNSCVHEFITYEDARPEEPVVRPVATHWSAGGKGFNAARVIHRLGGDVLALGPAGGMHGEILRSCLAQQGTPFELVPVAADTRVSHCLYETGQGRFRELLEPGADATREEARALEARALHHLPGASFLTLHGSSPGPILSPLFGRLVQAAKARGVPVLVDSHGEPGRQAAREAPLWVRCNRDELRDTHRVPRDGSLEDWWKEHADPHQGLLVSDGSGPIRLLLGERGWRAAAPAIREVNPVGSGDALTGAFTLALDQGRPLSEALRHGVAAGAANAESLEICDLDPGRWSALLEQVQVQTA